MINIENLKHVKHEMNKLRILIDAVLDKDIHNTIGGEPSHDYIVSGKRTGAVRRQSMELTNALVELRRS